MKKKKRALLFKICNSIRHFIDAVFGRNSKLLFVYCPKDFHYSHIQPVIAELSKDENFKITVLKWDGFCEKQIANVRYIDKSKFRNEVFRTYDWYLTTEFGNVPRWFKGVVRIFFLHGIGPKVSYFATNKLKDFDVVLASGPYIEDRQSPFISKGTQLVSVGLPVLDRFFCNNKYYLPDLCQFDSDLPVLLYAPSWSNDCDQISMDTMLIRALIEQKVCNVILRPHPNLFDPARCGGYDWAKTISGLLCGKKNMIVYSGSRTNVYDIISSVDFLLSDISSVLYEFLVFDRPILIYLKDSTGEYYDCDEYLSFTKNACHSVYRADDISSVLSECIEHPELLSSQRAELLKLSLFNYGNATAEMCRYFEYLRCVK